MREQRGLPIAAHLGLMVAIAFASAFVVMLAVIIFLPPRPPDVTRGDDLVEQFAAGFDTVRRDGDLPSGDAMVWRVSATPPRQQHSQPLSPLQRDLSERIALAPDKIIISAETARSDVFVFRVRDVRAHHELRRQFEDGRETIIVEENLGEGEKGPVIQLAPTVEAHRQAMEVHVGELRMRRAEPAVPNAAAPPRPPAPSVAPPAPVAPMPPLFAPAPPGVLLLSGYTFAAQLPDGRWLSMSQGRDWEQLSWIGRAALVIGITLTMLSLLALLFARRLARPIQSFAHAVEAVGVDPQREAVIEEGPRELRGAARAINTMQARLRALIADRTKTLAAVAHDMRTPLMRLRLAAENVPAESRDRVAKEIEEVEALVASFIAFARDDPAEEARVRIDLAALLQSLTDDHAEAGRAVSFNGDERLVITGQSLGLKRLFSNLIDNALKYGAAARVSLTRGDGVVIVDIADDGPGVPAAQRESVFEPFVRLSQSTANGAGLGLPAARGIARAHGGDIVFLDAEAGARVRVTLPA
jgi:signal transduction histidine kinase